MHSGLLASADVVEIRAAETYSSIHPTNIKCVMYKHSRDDEVTVTMRSRPSNNINNNNGSDDYYNNIDL
jgi:hypothetical protein